MDLARECRAGLCQGFSCRGEVCRPIYLKSQYFPQRCREYIHFIKQGSSARMPRGTVPGVLVPRRGYVSHRILYLSRGSNNIISIRPFIPK